MGAGLALVVVGALLTFAVEDHVPNLNLKVAGLILMIAGGVVIAHARATEGRQKRITLVDESSDPDVPTHTVEETIRETD